MCLVSLSDATLIGIALLSCTTSFTVGDSFAGVFAAKIANVNETLEIKNA
jgi:hypothetical protein